MRESKFDAFRTERENKKFGINVRVRNEWVRHAQKRSGNVFSKEGAGISTSSISPKGADTSKELGRRIAKQVDVVKAYVSDSARTRETVDNIYEGYEAQYPDLKKHKTDSRKELSVSMPAEFEALYAEKFALNKRLETEKRGYSQEEFDTLSADEQEEIAEAAEEPIVREWLDNPESDLAQLYPKFDAASAFAKIFYNHHRIARFCKPESDVELLHVTHKTITEPFLTSGVLTRVSDGEKITSIAEIGGSLPTLGNWSSEVILDSEGKPKMTVQIGGEEYIVDIEQVRELATQTRYKKET